jgi:TolB protein
MTLPLSIRFLALWVLVMVFSASAIAQTPLRVDVTEGHLDPMKVAITDFVGSDAQASASGSDIARVVTNNLKNTGLFAPIDQVAFVEEITDIDLRPRFIDWRVIEASALLVGRVTIDDDDRMTVAFRLWDSATEQQLLGLQFVTSPDNWRRIAHKVSDAVYERLTGESGYFDTRIIYVSEGLDGEGVPYNRLAVMDQDGANPSFLTDRSYMALLPNYSPSAQQITYVSFRDNKATSYLFDLETARQESLFDGGANAMEQGQSLSARFHPDGRTLVVSIERRNGHDLFEYDLRFRTMRQLTSHPADDTEPSYSPDGEKIVFSSTRSGSSQLYVMNAEGSDETSRISFGEGRYNTPVWSPRGDLIAFTKQYQGRFMLGVIEADGSGRERILYEGFFVDSPAWSPNGRVVLFTRGDQSANGTQYSIWSVDLAGFNLRRLAINGQSSDPAWSPLID